MAKVALITGSAKRIGAAIARHMHKEGFDVMLHAHSSIPEAQDLCDGLNKLRKDSAAVCFADLALLSSAEELIRQTIKWRSQLDCLVHNASLFIDDSKLNDEIWQTLFSVNVKTPYYLSKNAYSFLAKTNGSIIYITDIHAYKALKGYSVYCQTKAALNMQMLSCAKEFAPLIRVNAIAPGAISWPLEDNTLNEQTKHNIIEKTLLKKHGDPLHIAQAALFLMQNDFITGQVLKIDGGR
ncbi:MAG: hypothetical protein A3F18_04580 [Legionellales bacterium RIFCSPHIGHO2_12_FULL_37_14]|nr:MAG: hypothetical protein A3F18_04580 [Legionellales bacterium RIFCSPHIGHO2_12_FULL_37_14]